MSHSLMKRFAGAAAAVTAGLLLLAAPAQAAPKTGASVGERAKATASAAEIAANNAAVWESLPSNVTMTVLGKMPKLQGPVDHYTQDGLTTKGVTTLAVATLPYSFTFSGAWDLTGRQFKSTQTKICMDIEATWDFPEGSYHKFQITLSSGGTVTVPTDGVARSYCWSGVPTNTTLTFRHHSTGNSGGDIAKASGSGQVRYP